MARVRAAVAELAGAGLVIADLDARLVWLPGQLAIDPPANPNIVKGWKATWEIVPECATKDLVRQQVAEFLSPKPSLLAAFVAFAGEPDGWGKRLGQTVPPNGLGQRLGQTSEIQRYREIHPPTPPRKGGKCATEKWMESRASRPRYRLPPRANRPTPDGSGASM